MEMCSKGWGGDEKSSFGVESKGAEHEKRSWAIKERARLKLPMDWAGAPEPTRIWWAQWGGGRCTALHFALLLPKVGWVHSRVAVEVLEPATRGPD